MNTTLKSLKKEDSLKVLDTVYVDECTNAAIASCMALALALVIGPPWTIGGEGGGG